MEKVVVVVVEEDEWEEWREWKVEDSERKRYGKRSIQDEWWNSKYKQSDETNNKPNNDKNKVQNHTQNIMTIIGIKIQI